MSNDSCVLPRWLSRKESACSVGDLCSIPGSGRSLEKEMATPLYYSYLGNPTDGGARLAIVHGVAKEFDTT